MTPLQKRITTATDALIERAQGLREHAPDRGPALDTLEWTAALRAELDDLETLIVRQARAEGASWGEIADPIGITRQGCQQRWG
jgi:hypothetical protein